MSYLDLHNKNLTTLEGIEFPDDLIVLDISHNKLTSLQYCPPNLKILYCWNNQLTSLQYCSPNLLELYCSNNQLTSLLYCPYNIKELNYHSNPIIQQYQNKTIQEINQINRVKYFQLGLSKINNLILNHKAFIIQRCWQDYWYKPNDKNESKIGLYYYQQYLNEIK